jgi:hypothetical protein
MRSIGAFHLALAVHAFLLDSFAPALWLTKLVGAEHCWFGWSAPTYSFVPTFPGTVWKEVPGVASMSAGASGRNPFEYAVGTRNLFSPGRASISSAVTLTLQWKHPLAI